ncbi:hypothetical protein [Alkalibaculum bacchi]|uniref:hypothetical protein n=1 Tax=Alkalibaculum bacchi TaxID=645887 RepID=UPI0026F2ADF0|nr:hypothetical protein [Alkalibaculum bacchi]
MLVSLTTVAFAESTSNTNPSFSTEELKATSQKVLQLVKEGKEDEAANLPEVKALKKTLESNTELANEYFSSLEAAQAVKENIKISIGKNESKIIEFEDGSFIQVSATTTQINQPTRDPGDIIYKARDHYQYTIWGIFPAATCNLYTDYNYGNYYVKITDTNATQRTNLPAWSTGCSSSIVSNTRSKGIFNFQDPAGSFGITLITDIIPGPFTVTVKHSPL